MARRLKDIPFDQWVIHVFDHECSKPEWYFDIDSDYWDGTFDLTVEYLTRLFEDPVVCAQGYTDEQINQGFEYLASNACSTHMFALLAETVPLESRVLCVKSFYDLFEKLFAEKCTPHLSHRVESGANPLNSVCYMWWDHIPITGRPDKPSRAEFDAEILDVMERILTLDSIACQESAIHGLGHWENQYPRQAHAIIDRFLQNHSEIRRELAIYALQARAGCVL